MKIKQLSLAILCLCFSGLVSANDLEGFTKACLSATNMGEVICQCVAKKADAELTANGFAFLLATLNKDKKTAEGLRWRLKQEELMQAGLFMAHAPGQCAKSL